MNEPEECSIMTRRERVVDGARLVEDADIVKNMTCTTRKQQRLTRVEDVGFNRGPLMGSL